MFDRVSYWFLYRFVVRHRFSIGLRQLMEDLPVSRRKLLCELVLVDFGDLRALHSLTDNRRFQEPTDH